MEYTTVRNVKFTRNKEKRTIVKNIDRMKLEGLRSIVFGYHSIVIHTLFVTLAWRKIFKTYPNAREFVCILFHDIGYISQREVQTEEDNHPELGARICGYLFGDEYYKLCIGHSRDYARKKGIKLSKLCYADKYCVILMPIRLHYIISMLDPGLVDVYKVVE